MKKSLHVILALTLILATAFTLLLATPTPVSAGGRVLNQGFESAFGGEWAVVNAQRTNTGLIHEGSWAAQITGAGGSLIQYVDVTPMAKYRCWGWIYATANVAGRIELTFMDPDGNPIGPGTVLSANNTAGYELRKADLRAPWNADYLRIRLVEGGWVGGQDVRFDDIGVMMPLFGCFIATAAYGTPMAEEIEVLRQFRDEYLLTNPAGGLLVSLYYTSSPPLAHLISQNEGLRAVTRMVLEPIIWFSSIFTGPPSP